ncbi:Replication factor C, subunit RFC4 [Elasticomyces elasticus]|uniref:Replication factor C, subunit RFC4 n=1 Tax=Elasticomyces elasticus TaxID=574655 RepID=A0AAN7WNG8_9PEZI|nr:Replication factor C, subunit RFC4 [Elasticomyces elasticus]KAK4980670.1 Replication factor C, subunit RFC4 [Elasticomyces elasticus]KAK5703231.1 Replication factor C, subunit RFC4 [Elasticomyces elasticus]KAK5730132.1 Replication factor C, subunit RFC4 [Elasticomyces elasticus]
MKILTQEEEREHYNATLYGGTIGGVVGTAAGALGVWAASQRYPAFRSLSIPFRAFLMTSTGTFSAIISADSYSRNFEKSRNPQKNYSDTASDTLSQAYSQKTNQEKATQWMSDNRYSVVFGSWVASMGTALGIVGRSPYLTTQQKLVQARVYAQGLTIAVVIISLAFEGSDSARGAGRWETVKILDPDDPTHKHVIEKRIHHERYAGEDQWRDMIAAEEERIKEREEAVKADQERQQKKKGGNGNGNGKKAEKKEESEKTDEQAHRDKMLHGGKSVEEDKPKKINAP